MKRNFYYYYILKDKNLVIEILRGTFELSDYLDLKKAQLEDPDYDPNFNLILDIRNVVDDVSKKTISSYVENIKPVQLFSKKIKAAVITNLPSQVAGATLYKLFEQGTTYCEVFSTLEYALKWVGIGEIDLHNIDFNKTGI